MDPGECGVLQVVTEGYGSPAGDEFGRWQRAIELFVEFGALKPKHTKTPKCA